MQSNSDNDSIVLQWLLRRKISQATIEAFEIHEGIHNALGKCIVIPVKNERGLFSFNKYRRHPLKEVGPKYVYDSGAHMALYGAWKLSDKEKETVIWCEGELDALVCWSHNIPAVSSTGGALSIKDDWQEFLKGKDVVLCFDNDESGGAGMVRALRVAPWARVMFLPDRPGIKDITDYDVSGGDLHELLKGAKRLENEEAVREDRGRRVALWQSTHFHDAYLRAKELAMVGTETDKKPRKTWGTIGDNSRLARAKSYPMTELIEFRKGAARCLWHDEREASLHYYPEENRAWCFGGCGRGYDAIDVYMKVKGVDFRQAIDEMQ